MKWLVVAILALAACGGSDAATPNRGTRPRLIETPATITGVVEISVEEGPVGDDELSEVNFGVLETPEGPVLIEVWADVARAAGLGRADLVAGGRFRVDLSGPAEYSSPDVPSFLVAALTPAD